jgi:hypothetical protein
VVAAEGVADIPPQLRIRKPLHRILLRRRTPVVAVVRIQAAAPLILPARSLVVEARIQAAVLLILLARIRVVVRILAAVRLMSLARSLVVVRIPAQRPAVARTLLLEVTAPVVVRVMRLRRSARHMHHKGISQAAPRALFVPMSPQTTVSTQMSKVAMLQIV